jgi:hypothetical protein
MMRYLTWLNIALCLCFTGCNRAALVKKVVPQEDEVFARKYVDLLRQRAFDQIEQKLDPSISSSDVRNTLTTMAEMLPAQEPHSTKVVAYNLRHSLTLEYEFPDKWILVDMSIKRIGDASTITGFRVTPILDSLEHVNRFSLAGKSTVQYAVLGLAVAAPTFTFYVLAVCLKTKNQTRKWLWAIFILVGVGKLGVNWTSGSLIFTPLAVNVPCGGATTTMGFYGPWVVTVNLPLGAILFLRRRSRRLASNQVHAADPAELP